MSGGYDATGFSGVTAPPVPGSAFRDVLIRDDPNFAAFTGENDRDQTQAFAIGGDQRVALLLPLLWRSLPLFALTAPASGGGSALAR